MRNILLAQNQYFSEELAIKVKRGMYDSFLRGYSSGSTIYGYDKIKVDPSNENSKTKKFVINKDEAEVVRGIYADYISGKKITDIKQRLDDNHIYNRKGKPFHKSSISNILQNRMYIGTLKFAEHVRENAVPAIIESEDIFMTALKRITKNKHQPQVHKAEEHYLLSLKTFCGHCKSTIIGDSGTGKKGQIYRYYTCTSRKKKVKPCEKKQVNKKWLEDFVVLAIMKYILTDKMIKKAVEMLLSHKAKVMQNTKLDSLESELKAICAELDNLVNAIAQGLAIGTIKDKVMSLEAKKVDLQNEIESEKLIMPVHLTADEYTYWFEQFRGGDVNDEKFRERLIDFFVKKVIVFNDKIIIVCNIKENDTEAVTIEEIIKDFEDSAVFGYEQIGDPSATRTRDTVIKSDVLYQLS